MKVIEILGRCGSAWRVYERDQRLVADWVSFKKLTEEERARLMKREVDYLRGTFEGELEIVVVPDGSTTEDAPKKVWNPYSRSRFELENLLRLAEKEGLFLVVQKIQGNDETGVLERSYVQTLKDAMRALKEREKAFEEENPRSVKSIG